MKKATRERSWLQHQNLAPSINIMFATNQHDLGSHKALLLSLCTHNDQNNLMSKFTDLKGKKVAN